VGRVSRTPVTPGARAPTGATLATADVTVVELAAESLTRTRTGRDVVLITVTGAGAGAGAAAGGGGLGMRVVEFQTGGELVVFSMVTMSGETGPRSAAIRAERTMEVSLR
jgi:hypothetical protein